MSIVGRIHALLLVLALAAGMVAWLAFFLAGEPRTSTPLGAAHEPLPARPSAPSAETAPVAIDPGAQSKPTAPGESSPAREASSDAPSDPSAKFEGRGVIRGELLVREGARVPERWTLFIEPHPWLEGSQHAATRRQDFEHGETQFDVRDLPLGGYLVRAQAGAQNCTPGNVLLVRGSADQFVTLLLLTSGFIDGGVLDSIGRPAEGLDVTLESDETHQRSTLSTDAAGTFVFRDVLDGGYRLFLGRPDSPLLPAESIAFKAPSLRFPTRTLPPTGALRITVIDESLRPRARVQISGSAPGSGTIDTFSDHLGIARARYLLPGHYRIDARSEDGLEASAAIDLDAEKETPLEMLVQKRRPSR